MKTILLLLYLIGYSFTYSQQISKFVISPSGDHIQSSQVDLDLHWTLGELTSTLITNSQIQLQQGFHQIEIMSVPVYEWNDVGPSVSVYPNPTSGRLVLSQDETKNYKITIRDLYGRILKTDVFETLNKEIDLSTFPDQTLLLTIDSEQLHKGLKIVKLSN
ncbi:MAG: T9SS type A sorting domain-containing protein [Saprospiraceae bacterium]|nr:T9SS type A sorting domain-containing protein [Saprospiraceae bacterium]